MLLYIMPLVQICGTIERKKIKKNIKHKKLNTVENKRRFIGVKFIFHLSLSM